MSEFSERHTASRLVGAPAGYVGYDDAGHLTEKIRRQPYYVVLFDEIEKAHSSIFNLLLQILEDGHLTDGHGRTVDFSNTVVILTSNVGAEKLVRDKLGFGADSDTSRNFSINLPTRHPELDSGSRKNKVVKDDTYTDWIPDQVRNDTGGDSNNIPRALHDLMRPELLNRFDQIITFNSLTRQEIYQILDLMIESLNQRLVSKGIAVVVSSSAKNLLIDRGYDPKFGARPLRREIENQLESLIAEKLITHEIVRGDVVRATARNGQLVIEKVRETATKVKV